MLRSIAVTSSAGVCVEGCCALPVREKTKLIAVTTIPRRRVLIKDSSAQSETRTAGRKSISLAAAHRVSKFLRTDPTNDLERKSAGGAPRLADVARGGNSTAENWGNVA